MEEERGEVEECDIWKELWGWAESDPDRKYGVALKVSIGFITDLT